MRDQCQKLPTRDDRPGEYRPPRDYQQRKLPPAEINRQRKTDSAARRNRPLALLPLALLPVALLYVERAIGLLEQSTRLGAVVRRLAQRLGVPLAAFLRHKIPTIRVDRAGQARNGIYHGVDNVDADMLQQSPTHNERAPAASTSRVASLGSRRQKTLSSRPV